MMWKKSGETVASASFAETCVAMFGRDSGMTF